MSLCSVAPAPVRELGGSRPASRADQRPGLRLPRHWLEQRQLLERQHDQLEGHLSRLIACHADDLPATRLQQAVERLACRRLLRDLRLHLRLEERWLAARGVLCSGHQANHRQVLQAAEADWQRLASQRAGRLALLQALQAWFEPHRQGPDATAYGLATATATATESAIESAAESATAASSVAAPAGITAASPPASAVATAAAGSAPLSKPAAVGVSLAPALRC